MALETDKNFEKLDKKVMLSWRISRLLGFLVATIVLLVARMIFMSSRWYTSQSQQYAHLEEWIMWGILLILGYMVIGIIVYPIIEYRQWKYQITEDKVLVQHGIFYMRTTVIPIARIQHVTIEQGLINRRLQLAQVTISLASGNHVIEGVHETVAEQISEQLKDLLYHRLEQKR